MTTPENTNHALISTGNGGLIRRMDQRFGLVNRLMEEIQAKQTGLSKTKTLEVPLGTGVVMVMKWCPPGSFLMGSPEDEEGQWGYEKQVHVTLSKGFWMGQTQVTQAQWQAVMGNNPSYFSGKNRPVEKVSWHDAQEFVSKINASFDLPGGMQMALPTEAMWEYACRAGETGPYSGGTLDVVAWYGENSSDETHPVGEKKANAWGLHDMHGNVWEWCVDWFEMGIAGGIDPQGASSGTIRVFRGGGWRNDARNCRAANRNCYNPTIRNNSIGFRTAGSSFS